MLSFIKSPKVNEISGEVFIYGDEEGLKLLINYLNYLLETKDTSIHLSEGNELSELDKEILPNDFHDISHVKIINMDGIVE